MENDTIVLSFEIELGQKGEDRDPANPLSRSANRLFEDGLPFKRLSQCFLREGADDPVLRWLGVFVLSVGDRVVFFPGFQAEGSAFTEFRGRSLARDQTFNFDHLTLERDFKRWHFTGPKSKEHIGSFNTLHLDQGRNLWLGMSLSDFSVLRTAMEKTNVTFTAPSSDSRRRLEVFQKSREEAMFQIVESHPEARKHHSPGFLHLAFIVGPSGFELYKGPHLAFPEGSPFLAKPLPTGLTKVPIRSHRVSLSSEVHLQITSAWLPGSLKRPVAFTSMGGLKENHCSGVIKGELPNLVLFSSEDCPDSQRQVFASTLGIGRSPASHLQRPLYCICRTSLGSSDL